jgi:hypothetical protein
MCEEAFSRLGNSLTQALITGDFDLYRLVMALPLRIVPRGTQAYVLADDAALERDFRLYARSIKTAGVTDIFREVAEVRPDANGGHRVFCTVHIMARAHRITEPFRSEMLLLPFADGLRIAEIVSTTEHIDWTLGRRALGPGSGLI